MISIRLKKHSLLFFIAFFLSGSFFNPANAAAPAPFSIPDSALVKALSAPDSLKLVRVKVEVANAIIDARINIGIWGVLIGINPDSIPPEKIFQHQYYNIKLQPISLRGLLNFEESLIITLVEFDQKGVPKDTKYSENNLKDNVLKPAGSLLKDLFGKKNHNGRESAKTEPFADNVQTRLNIFVQAVDIRKERLFGNFSITIVHTGGDKFQSFEKALEKLVIKATIELKILFLLSSEVTFLADNYGKISLTGKYIEPGMYFELIEPDRAEQVGNEIQIINGKRAGIAVVTDTLAQHSLIQYVRKWKPRSPGFWAIEYNYPIFALQVNYQPPSRFSYQRLDFQFNFTPLKKFDSGGGFHLFKIEDDRDHEVGGFGLYGFMLWRILYSNNFTIGTKFGFDLDFPIRKDDAGNVVTLAIPSIFTSINTEFLISEKVDLVLNVGYRLAEPANSWEYTVEDDESVPAYWVSHYPKVNNTGLILSLGLRYLIF